MTNIDAPRAYRLLLERLGRIMDLRAAESLLDWDQQTMMPPRAAHLRARQRETVVAIAHELFVAEETGRLLRTLESYERSLDPDSNEAGIIRVTRRDYEKELRVPTALRAEMAHAESAAVAAWEAAGLAKDFALFRPAMKRNFDLRRRYVACFDGVDDPYDVVLGDYEYGTTTADVAAVFAELRAMLVPLVAAAATDEDDFLDAHFSVAHQRELGEQVVAAFGMRDGTWRIDPSTHSMQITLGIDDVRLTAFDKPARLATLFTVLHEYGHALYSNRVDLALERTPLIYGVSVGVHESQSRLWENIVGRSPAFWQYWYPRLQERFKAQLSGVAEQEFVAEINRVRRTLVRTTADEATYNLHVIMRFELERELLYDAIDLERLPAIWNDRVGQYLGLDVPNDVDGVLQESHWASSLIGYIPTYALGNIMAVQRWERAQAELADLEQQISRGEFAPLREWLRVRVHQHGRKFTPKETLERAVGSGLDAGPYLRYLQRKFEPGARTVGPDGA